MKTRPVICNCGCEPEVTSPSAERNCWMVMCINCRRNGPSVMDPGGREQAVAGWNLGLDDHFLLGRVGEQWHYFGGRPRYEYTQSELAEAPGGSSDSEAAGLNDSLSAGEIMEYAARKGDPDLIWLARRLRNGEGDSGV